MIIKTYCSLSTSPIRTLDVANNQLESISLPNTDPIARRLDVSCNARLRLPSQMPQVRQECTVGTVFMYFKGYGNKTGRNRRR